MRFIKSFHKTGVESGIYFWYILIGLMGATYFIGNALAAVAMVVGPFTILMHSFFSLLTMYEN